MSRFGATADKFRTLSKRVHNLVYGDSRYDGDAADTVGKLIQILTALEMEIDQMIDQDFLPNEPAWVDVRNYLKTLLEQMAELPQPEKEGVFCI